MTYAVPQDFPNIPPGTTGGEHHLHEGQRLGLLPPQGRPVIPFSKIVTPAASALVIPDQDDHIQGVPAWNLGANNTYGTCGPTSLANYITMVYWNLLGLQVTVTDDAIFALYKASGNPGFPAEDNGVDMNYMLTQALSIGLEVTYTGVTNPAVFRPGANAPLIPVAGATELVKPVAFAGIKVSKIEELRAATAIFGGVELGVTLMTSQQSQTASGCWDYSPAGIWGGHAIMGAAYTGKSSGADEEIITWAEPVGTTDSFISNQLDQAFAVILPVHLTHPAFLAGVDIAALASEYKALTGRDFPA